MEKEFAVRMLSSGSEKELSATLGRDPGELLVVSPFITESGVGRIPEGFSGKIRVITRFSLLDFALGSSDIAALRALLQKGARIRGVKDLHSKMYVFGSDRMLVTSSNLTHGGAARNHELGVVSQDRSGVDEGRQYFEGLWKKCGPDLRAGRLGEWERRVSPFRSRWKKSRERAGLEDFGVDLRVDEPSGDSRSEIVREVRWIQQAAGPDFV